MKKTLILGASTNPERYSYKAANKLVQHGHDIVNVGIDKGILAGVEIEKADVIHTDVDTVTVYLGLKNQKQYYDYILHTNPSRIIFNPGAENPELEEIAHRAGIATENACTLVLLSTAQF